MAKKVILKRYCMGPDGDFPIGTERSFPDKEADRLITKGYADLVIGDVKENQEPATPPSRPVFLTSVFEAVKDAIDKGEVTAKGAPTVDALKVRLGREVSAEERSRMFEDYQILSGADE